MQDTYTGIALTLGELITLGGGDPKSEHDFTNFKRPVDHAIEAMESWCVANCADDWRQTQGVFEFANRDDAMHFRLTFGGTISN